MIALPAVIAVCAIFGILFNPAHASLTPVDTETFFVTPGEPATLRWKLDRDGIPASANFTLSDYHGTPVSFPGIPETLSVKDDRAELTLTLPEGYFEISVPLADNTPDSPRQIFGVMSIAAFDRSRLDPYFCLDSVLTWLERSAKQRVSLIRMMRRAGVALSRERFSWGAVSPARGEWNWSEPKARVRGGTEGLRKIYEREQMPVLECFHGTPKWMGLNNSYPVDLPGATDDMLTIARRWRPSWGGFEVWNEPNAGLFAKNRAMDQYTAFVHALAWAFDNDGQVFGQKIPLVGGSFAGYHKNATANAFRNDLLQSVDALSYHTYTTPQKLEAGVREFRDAARHTARPGIPIWITETGSPWTGGVDRPVIDEDLVSALSITGKAFEGRATGIERIFPFVTPWYAEGKRNFGMVGKEGTPLRSIATYAAAIRILAHHDYIGDFRFPEKSPVQLSRVFTLANTPGEALLVLYTGVPKTGATVSFDLPVRQLRGIDGRPLVRADEKTLPADDGLTYVWLDRSVLDRSGRLGTETSAMALYREARQPDTGRPPASPVILQFIPDEKRIKFGTEINAITPGSLDAIPFRIRAVNLDTRAARTVTVSLAAGPRGKAATPIPGVPSETITLPPRSGHDFTWQIDLKKFFDQSPQVTIRINGILAGDGQPAIRTLSVDLAAELPLETLRKFYTKRLEIPVRDAAKWNTRYVSRKTGGEMQAVQNKDSVAFNISFQKDGDSTSYWAYPRIAVPRTGSGDDLDGAEGILVRARVTFPGTIRAFLWKRNEIGYLTSQSLMPADGEWHTVFFPIERLGRDRSTSNASDPVAKTDLGNLVSVAFGVNSDQHRNTVEISDFYIVWPPQ
ncbi:hypothetical protein OpiT1DRAFT_02647 [Opitutaceae bacterium TAV1]|nr:hypothetical protein OpiT1DRAFT_02647 [Opitutaceae bacterium TAV1]